jgi:hypothetical protein
MAFVAHSRFRHRRESLTILSAFLSEPILGTGDPFFPAFAHLRSAGATFADPEFPTACAAICEYFESGLVRSWDEINA